MTGKTSSKGKKGLKIPNGQSEFVYRRRTDNTMTKNKQHTYKTKDRVTRTPLKTGDELRRVNLVTNPVTSHE